MYPLRRADILSRYPNDCAERREELVRLDQEYADAREQLRGNWTEPDVEQFGSLVLAAWNCFWDLQPDRPIIATMAGAWRDRIPYKAKSRWLRDHDFKLLSFEGRIIKEDLLPCMENEAMKWENRKEGAADSDSEGEKES